MDEIKESLESQLVSLYMEKDLFEDKIGCSDPREIVEKFKNLENELISMYDIKERYRKVPSPELKITNIKNVFVDRSKLKGSK